MASSSNPFSTIPSIEHLLQRDDMLALADQAGHEVVRDCLRAIAARLRQSINDGAPLAAPPETANWFASEAVAAVAAVNRSSLVSVFNLTGTVLHTNLGRATLPASAIAALVSAASNPTTIEYDLVSGKRGDRDDHVEKLLCDLTGAEAATVINNNAAAVMLCLNSLALNRQIPVSRGELIEIGGSFRMPQIMERSGCHLVEVGTTNRTHLADYADAITADTAALMIVHPSNYEVRGFTIKPARGEIAALAHQHHLPLIDDLGSGTLIDLEPFGLPHEDTVAEAVKAGADVVTFSGDKLLGGPQAGIIVGRAQYINQIRKNPMKRAMRVDKLILSALEAVLQLYRNPSALMRELPVMRMLGRPLTEIDACAQRLSSAFLNQLSDHGTYSVVDCQSQVGSGALPGDGLPSRAVCITPKVPGGTGVNTWSKALRCLSRPVIGRISDDRLILDMRTMEDEPAFIAQLVRLDLALRQADRSRRSSAC